jgi:hypothetical protein
MVREQIKRALRFLQGTGVWRLNDLHMPEDINAFWHRREAYLQDVTLPGCSRET